MTAPIEDVSSLPGKKVSDQEEVPIGEVKEIYATDGFPTWVAVEASFGVAEKRLVFIPLARLKEEDGSLQVPYSKNHVGESPEIDGSDGIDEEADRKLRVYYAIDAADHELRTDNKSYATMVPDEPGTSEKVEDVGSIEAPDPDKRTEETESRLHDPGDAEMRKVSADQVAKGDDVGSENDDAEERSEARDEEGDRQDGEPD